MPIKPYTPPLAGTAWDSVYDPRQASVFDSTLEKVVRTLATITGINDPTQIPAALTTVMPSGPPTGGLAKRVLFHGSPQTKLNELRLPKATERQWSAGPYERAVWLTDNADDARGFAGRNGSVYEVAIPESEITDTVKYAEFDPSAQPLYDPDVMEKILASRRGNVAIEGVQNFEHGGVSNSYAIRDEKSVRLIEILRKWGLLPFAVGVGAQQAQPSKRR